MNKATTNSKDWGKCPPGVLAEVVQRAQTQRRLQRARTLGGLAAIGLFVGVTAAMINQGWRGEGVYFGGLSCAQTQSLLPRFAAGKLDIETNGRVDEHLSKCARCKDFYQQMKSIGDEIAYYEHAGDGACDHCTPSP